MVERVAEGGGVGRLQGPERGPLLVIGATGWVGRTLLDLAKASDLPIVGVARQPDANSGFERCDASQPDAVDRLFQRLRPDVVFNCIRAKAEEFGSSPQRRRPAGITELGVLLDASVRYGSRLVHVGSASEYGGSLRRRPVTERARPRPLTSYGRLKLAQTRLVLNRARRGADVVVGRVFNLVGPGEGLDTVTGSWIARLASPSSEIGGLVEVAATVRDFVDVRDAARALVLLGARPEAKGVYNICSGRGTRIDHVVRTVARILSADVRVRSLKPRRDSGPAIAVGSSTRLRRLGWTPSIPLEQSVLDVVKQWCVHDD